MQERLQKNLETLFLRIIPKGKIAQNIKVATSTRNIRAKLTTKNR